MYCSILLAELQLVWPPCDSRFCQRLQVSILVIDLRVEIRRLTEPSELQIVAQRLRGAAGRFALVLLSVHRRRLTFDTVDPCYLAVAWVVNPLRI